MVGLNAELAPVPGARRRLWKSLPGTADDCGNPQVTHADQAAAHGDPYIPGVKIKAAEPLAIFPPEDVGASGSLQSFGFRFRVPRDYNNPISPKNSYELYAEVLRQRPKATGKTFVKLQAQKLQAQPFFVYLCGGPGSGQKPSRHEEFNRYVVANGFQMLVLDYRGCGRSTPLTAKEALEHRAWTLTCKDTEARDIDGAVEAFQESRQGNIVRDLEAVRKFFISYIPDLRRIPGGDQFVLCGQSFGGWIALTYIDRFPRSIRAALLTGGIPPLNASPVDVYERLFDSVVKENERFYRRFPDAGEKVKRIARVIRSTPPAPPARDPPPPPQTTIVDDEESSLEIGGQEPTEPPSKPPKEQPPPPPDSLGLVTFASLGRILGEPNGAQKLYDRICLIEAKLDASPADISHEELSLLLFPDVDTHRFNERLVYALDHEIQCYHCYVPSPADPQGAGSSSIAWAAQKVRDEGVHRHRFAWMRTTPTTTTTRVEEEEIGRHPGRFDDSSSSSSSSSIDFLQLPGSYPHSPATPSDEPSTFASVSSATTPTTTTPPTTVTTPASRADEGAAFATATATQPAEPTHHDHDDCNDGNDDDGNYYFLGEAFMPEHAEDYSSLRQLGGAAFADSLARAGQTEQLFDRDRLRENKVPIFAIVYPADMYVDADLATDAARDVGCLKVARLPDESPLRHNAIREEAAEVVRVFRELGFGGFPVDPEEGWDE